MSTILIEQNSSKDRFFVHGMNGMRGGVNYISLTLDNIEKLVSLYNKGVFQHIINDDKKDAHDLSQKMENDLSQKMENDSKVDFEILRKDIYKDCNSYWVKIK